MRIAKNILCNVLPILQFGIKVLQLSFNFIESKTVIEQQFQNVITFIEGQITIEHQF